jgi:hypothetical protein
MDLQRILNTPQRRLPSEIPETPSPITSLSRASTQSWDSQNGPRPSTQATEDSQSSVSSFDTVTTFVTTTPPRNRSEECTRDKRIQIQTAPRSYLKSLTKRFKKSLMLRTIKSNGLESTVQPLRKLERSVQNYTLPRSKSSTNSS